MRKQEKYREILEQNLPRVDQEAFIDWQNSPVTKTAFVMLEQVALRIISSMNELPVRERFGIEGAVKHAVADGIREAVMFLEDIQFVDENTEQ